MFNYCSSPEMEENHLGVLTLNVVVAWGRKWRATGNRGQIRSMWVVHVTFRAVEGSSEQAQKEQPQEVGHELI